MKHVFVFNPKSFAQKTQMEYIIDTIGQFFRKQERPHFSVQISHFPRDAIGIIKREVTTADENETVRVYAVGGDGILFDCLNGIVGLPNMELAAIPYGKTNDFLRVFGTDKMQLFRDIGALVSAKALSTDVIAFGSNYAINTLTIGMESLAVVNMNSFSRKYPGLFNRFNFLYNFFFTINSTVALFDHDVLFQRYNIAIDNIDFSGEYSGINIANGPCYGGNKSAIPMARPDDGILHTLLFKPLGAIGTQLVLPSYLKGKTPSNCKLIQAKKLEIRSELPLQIQADGEIFFDTNITIEVKPAAVRFVAVDNLTYGKAEG
jgi:YegS/Rv2252/BmrU family lipid kinase